MTMLNMTKLEAARFFHELYRGERCICCGRPSVSGVCPTCRSAAHRAVRLCGTRREIQERREIMNANAGDHRLQSHRRACRITA